MRKLFFGDNLDILRQHVVDESVDLIYLDPPFNSKSDYNLLFRSPDGNAASAQALAFEDTWRWGLAAEQAFRDIVAHGGAPARLIGSLRHWMQESDVMAYLVMMTVRLIELHRVLKSTGSLYLHCDPAASHYLKMMLDAIFGPSAFKSEIVWKRTNARGTTGKWPALHDILLFYTKTDRFHFEAQKGAGDPNRVPHTLITGPDGRKYQTYELTGPGRTLEGESGREWRGFDPSRFGRHWGQSEAERDRLDFQGLIHWPSNGGFPRRKAEEAFDPAARLVTVGDVWIDIDRLNQTAKERLGYPTQKPLALLERILEASSIPGDLVLDPFCGCGTTVHAAEKLGRGWVGIDVTNYAVKLISERLSASFADLRIEIDGRPQDYADAVALAERNKYQFQWWACDIIGAQRYRDRKKGPDGGVDGEILFLNGPRGVGRIIVSVKGGKTVGVDAVRELRAVVDQQGADMGVLVSLADPSKDAVNAALSAGVVRTVHGEFHKLQLAPMRELFEGRRPRLPVPAPAALLRPPKGPKKKADKQLNFTFAFGGHNYQRPASEDGVVLDPGLLVGRGG
ncbi:DNA methyltransferase [Sphingomonas psychrotolerans]|uniref:site-specific DNA-methyltransferase (adenine-specific) n=1 Tax=Sphingomonas psychrotolerans TaxID=1327635 RepID=A0A2K8MJ01_9SPHN|nr:DNA methyltransferase [Sphingomonas psychrotolerans]ATY32974.1 site-specific DNA-methyltransferase [Sphingomonas psychrotolerans]